MMQFFVPNYDWNDVERQEICYGTTRGLRVVRVGRVFFIEQAKLVVDKTEWTVCAVAKDQDPRRAYAQAMEGITEANLTVLAELHRRHAQRKPT